MMQRHLFCHPHQPCFGRLVNYKANEDGPNLKSKVLVVDGLKRPFLTATRDITAGEELYFDYGVRPGQYNEGHEQIFSNPKARKRNREVLMALTMEKMSEEVRSEEPQLSNAMEEMPEEASSVKPQLPDAMEETHIEVSSEESSEPTQTIWWEPTQMVKVNEKSDSSDESIASQELSVIVQQVPGGSGKKTKQHEISRREKSYTLTTESDLVSTMMAMSRFSLTREGQEKEKRSFYGLKNRDVVRSKE